MPQAGSSHGHSHGRSHSGTSLIMHCLCDLCRETHIVMIAISC